MTFERGIFLEAWHVLLACRKWAFIVALIVAAATFLSLSSNIWGRGLPGIAGLAWLFLAYRDHAVLLSVNHEEDIHLRRSIGFVLRAIGIGLLSLVPIILIVIFGQSMITPLGNGSALSGLFIVLMIVGILVMTLASIWLGTLLPAYVAAGDSSINAAIRRGKRQWKFILGKYFTVIVATFIVTFIFSLVFIPIISGALSSLDIQSANAESLQEIDNFIQLILLLPSLFVTAYSTLLVPVILSRAYLIDEAERNGVID